MPGNQRRTYWDANCFLSYINEDDTWIETLSTLLEDANKGEFEIVTSILSKTEVAFSSMERVKRVLTTDEEERIDKLWTANRGVMVVEYSDLVAIHARDIRRGDMMRGWTGYRTPDIIHMATAVYKEVEEMHTTEGGLHRYGSVLGFPVQNPHTPKQRLPGV